MPIKIKDSKKGTFTAAAKKRGKSVKEFEQQVLSHPDNYSPAMRKKAQFSHNARSWNKGQNGISIPNNFQQADEEMYRRWLQEQERGTQSVNTFQGTDSDVQPISENNEFSPIGGTEPPKKKEKAPYQGQYGDAALMGLLAVDALIPNKKASSQVVRPLESYNPHPYGTGSTSIAQNGASMAFSRSSIPVNYDEMQQNFQSSKKRVDAARTGGYDVNPTFASQGGNNYLNPQQEYFYRALTSPNQDISSIYKGFNEELAGVEALGNTASVRPNSSPFTGTTLLADEDKSLLQDEYINFSKRFKGDKQRYFKDLQNRGASDERVNNLIPAASFAFGEMYENGGKISNSGYRFNSPDRWAPKLTIPSNYISMENVPHNVYGVDDTGYAQMMTPGNNYQFPGEYVEETPIRKMGGKVKCANGSKMKSIYKEGDTYELDDNTIRSLIAEGYEIKIH